MYNYDIKLFYWGRNLTLKIYSTRYY